MSKRVAGGLAWAGLLLVVAVPSADAITAVFIPKETNPAALPIGDTASVADAAELIAPIPATRSTMVPAVIETAVNAPAEEVVDPAIDPIETAAIETEVVEEPVVAATELAAADPVETFLDRGKTLPSYISGDTPAEDVAAAAPAEDVQVPALDVTEPEVEVATIDVPITDPEPATDPIEVASIDPGVVETPVLEAPVPMPFDMRPKVTEASFRQNNEVVLPGDDVLLPPNDVGRDVASTRVITEDDLEDWESGRLSDYLEREGLVDDNDSRVVIRHRSSDFDDDDYFDRSPRHRRADRILIGPVDDDDGFFDFFD